MSLLDGSASREVSAGGPSEERRPSTRLGFVHARSGRVPFDDAADRKREGLRVCRAAWLVGVRVREYREIEAGDRMPSLDVYRRISELYGWAADVRRERRLTERPPNDSLCPQVAAAYVEPE